MAHIRVFALAIVCTASWFGSSEAARVLGSSEYTSAIADMVKRFAPQIRLHSGEDYFPASVNDFMTMSTMWYGSSENNGALATPHNGPVTADSISLFRNSVNGAYTSGAKSVPGQFRLILGAEDAAHRSGRTSIKNGNNLPPVYVVVKDASSFYEINYVTFYNYNGPTSRFISGLGAHEGDFEHVTVRVQKGSETILGVYLSAHGSESKWYATSDITFVYTSDGGKHPAAYSSKDSHAHYNKAGTYERIGRDLGIITIHFAADKCDDGYSWNTWENVVAVGNYTDPEPSQRWTRYNGRWGRYKNKGCFDVYIPFVGDRCIVDYPDEDGTTNLGTKDYFFALVEGGPTV